MMPVPFSRSISSEHSAVEVAMAWLICSVYGTSLALKRQ